MTKQEFEQRVGIEVSTSEFKGISVVCKNCDLGEDEFLKVWESINEKRIREEMRKKEERRIEYFLVVYDGVDAWNDSFFEEDIIEHFGLSAGMDILHKAEKVENNKYEFVDIKGWGTVRIWWMRWEAEDIIEENRANFEKKYA